MLLSAAMFMSFCAILSLGFSVDALVTVQITQWTLKNSNGSIHIAGKVPGGVYSDLHNAEIIDDILYRFNDVLTRWVAYETWTYEGEFEVTAEEHKYQVTNLVLYGVDTVASIELNGQRIGNTDNMFVRYVFDVKGLLRIGPNTVTVHFTSPIEAAKIRSEKYFVPPQCVPSIFHGECHVNQLRKMQASFGWDLGPAFPSVGLWKPAVMEYYNTAIIRSVTTHLKELNGSEWYLTIRADLEVKASLDCWSGRATAELTVESGKKIVVNRSLKTIPVKDTVTGIELNLTVSKSVVRTWWPNGYGDQPLYDLVVLLESSGGELHYKSMQIGFRTVQLVQEAFDNAGKGLSFYFRVNGRPIFMKGSNWIPSHILPELSADVDRVEFLLTSAKDAHMNMLRVWGGGLYEWEYFYKLCDQMGILVWQDFLFACSLYPVDKAFIDSVKIEIEQNVKRIQYHPSIALWAGNNENEIALRDNWYSTEKKFDRYKADYITLYVDTIKAIVKAIDPERQYVVSSPSNGIQSEIEGYIASDPSSPYYGDSHFYNYEGDNWDYFTTYPRTRFASEYGFQSLPSFKTLMTATSEDEDFHIRSEFQNHRQHSLNGFDTIMSQVQMHMNLDCGAYKLDDTDVNFFKRLTFYSQINQAMSVKIRTEMYREMQADWYTMGALYWQLNDVWQAPSWSGIEYGNTWKMLHYFAVKFFNPVTVFARLRQTGETIVYVSNDRFVPILDGHIRVDLYNWDNFSPVMSVTYPAKAQALSTTKQDIQLPFINLWDKAFIQEVFIMFTLTAKGVDCPPNFLIPVGLKETSGIKEPEVRISVPKIFYDDQKQGYAYVVKIKVDTIVVFFWMETSIENGRFEDNGLLLTKPVTEVNYFNKRLISADTLRYSISYQYYTNE